MNYKTSLESIAELAPDYVKDCRTPELVTQYANEFCEAMKNNDEASQDIYIACLTLKLWHLADKAYKKYGHSLKLSLDDFVSWLQSAIVEACREESWIKNPTLNAQQVIATKFQTRYVAMANYESNLHINKANYGTLSMDVSLDDEDNTLVDTLKDDSVIEYSGQADVIIQDYIDQSKIVEAIILETIAYNNCEKENKKVIKEISETGEEYKYTQISREFWPYKVVQILNNLPEDYIEYFRARYSVAEAPFKEALNKIKSVNNQKLYKYLEETLADFRDYAN